MTRFVLTRLLFLFPTVILVLVAAFYLAHVAPGDVVDASLQREGLNDLLDRERYLSQYKTVQANLGKDRPAFYFSIKPNYLPSDLSGIIPKSYRENILKISHQNRDWSSVQMYHEELQRCIRLAEEPGVQPNDVVQNLLTISQSHDISEIQNLVRKVQARLENEASFPDLSQSLTDLRASASRLSNRSSSWFYPTVRFNGTRCEFHYWISRLFDRDSNLSLTDGVPALTKIITALKWTMSITVVTLFLTFLLSLSLGFFQVRYRGSVFDSLITAFSFIFFAVPLFWLATLMVVFFTTNDYGAWTNIFPSIGVKYWLVNEPFYRQVVASMGQLVLPIICLTLSSLAFVTAQVKSSLQKAISLPFIQTSRAKGLDESYLLMRHALPNAALPLITLFTGAIPGTIVGSVIIEVIFNIPGLGRLMLQSIVENDWPVSFLIIVIISVVTVLSYLLADVLNVVFFPKMAKNNLVLTGSDG